MSTNPVVPILSQLAPNGFTYPGQYLVEYDPDSLWYETSLTITALALRQGFKTEYHVFDHFPDEARRALKELGVDAPTCEENGLLRVWDSYTETTEFEKARAAGVGWETADEKPLDIVRGAARWVERTKKGYDPGEMRWLHLDDNTGIFLQYNDEETVVDRWRTALLPAVRARECPHFLAFPKGIASPAFYTKFEALCDGIIDLKTEEVEGRVERFLRVRRLRAKVFDTRWHRLEIQPDGLVRLVDLPSATPSRRLAAIVFTDLEGFTRLAHEEEPAALDLLKKQEAVLGPLLPQYHGRRVKSMGDGLLLEFPNARDAVEWGIEFQRQVRDLNATGSSRPLRVRVGIHVGDVEPNGPDILGDAVNLAARIEPLADVGGVCISSQVYDQVRHQLEYTFEKMAPRAVKGVREPIETYRVLAPGSPPRLPS